jgi:hypothetical protein
MRKGKGSKDSSRRKGGGCKYSIKEREGDEKNSERGARTIPKQRESFKYITQEGKGMKDSIKGKGE